MVHIVETNLLDSIQDRQHTLRMASKKQKKTAELIPLLSALGPTPLKKTWGAGGRFEGPRFLTCFK